MANIKIKTIMTLNKFNFLEKIKITDWFFISFFYLWMLSYFAETSEASFCLSFVGFLCATIRFYIVDAYFKHFYAGIILCYLIYVFLNVQ